MTSANVNSIPKCSCKQACQASNGLTLFGLIHISDYVIAIYGNVLLSSLWFCLFFLCIVVACYPYLMVIILALCPTAGSRVDTGTFTRPKKGREKLQPGNFEKENDPRDDAQRNANVADIETLAKMQEESKTSHSVSFITFMEVGECLPHV